eukprot:3015164-Amphidinium_carterae.2
MHCSLRSCSKCAANLSAAVTARTQKCRWAKFGTLHRCDLDDETLHGVAESQQYSVNSLLGAGRSRLLTIPVQPRGSTVLTRWARSMMNSVDELVVVNSKMISAITNSPEMNMSFCFSPTKLLEWRGLPGTGCSVLTLGSLNDEADEVETNLQTRRK